MQRGNIVPDRGVGAPGRVIVTGASSGIGRSLALHYARLGCAVGATARRADLLAELAHAGAGTVHTAVADVADRPGVTAALRELEAKLGGVDTLIANAGVGLPSGGVWVNAAGVETMIRVNVLGVVNSFAAVLPGMLAGGRGHLVAVSSMAAFKGLPGAAGYSASKAAVLTYCEALRIELAPRGVAVTCVCPGFIATPMTAPNPHPMPWIMTADAAAVRIAGALRRKPAVYSFPKRMRLLMALTKWLPDSVIRRRVPVPPPEGTDGGTG